MRDDSNLTIDKRIINKKCFFQQKLQTREANAFVSQKKKLLIIPDSYPEVNREKMPTEIHARKQCYKKYKRNSLKHRATYKNTELFCCQNKKPGWPY